MATINMPKKDKEQNDEVLPPRIGQSRVPLERYRLQVDRQIKDSFASLEEAEETGKAIKKAHPILQVSIYDSQQSQQIVLE
jgi:hypothetical protein